MEETKHSTVAPFEESLQTKNLDVFLIKPICFWRVDGEEANYKMTYEDSITPSIEHICTNFTKESAREALTHVIRNSWLHRKILGISVKLFLYTSNANIYSVVTLGCRSHVGKGVKGYFKAHSANMYEQEDALVNFLFFFIITLLVFACFITYLFKLYQNGLFIHLTRFRYLCHAFLVLSGFAYLALLFFESYYSYKITYYYQFSYDISYYGHITKLTQTAFLMTTFWAVMKLFLFATYHLRIGKYYFDNSFTENLFTMWVSLCLVYYCISILFNFHFGDLNMFKGIWKTLVSVFYIPLAKKGLASQVSNAFQGLILCPFFLLYLFLFVLLRHLAFAFLCFEKEWRELKPYRF